MKLRIILLALILALTLCSCDKDGKKDENVPESTVTSTEGSTDAPVTDEPNTNVPSTDEPETNAPVTDETDTDEPETNAPETAAPETQVPETDPPATEAPETDPPETQHVHTWSEATCLSPKTCGDCGETEGDPLGHSYVKDTCSRCDAKDPEYRALDSGRWWNRRAVDGSLVTMHLCFTASEGWEGPHWSASYGVDVNTLEPAFRDELLSHKDEIDLPEVDGVYYYVGMGDGYDLIFTEDGNTVTANLGGDTPPILVFERISGKELKLVSFTDEAHYYDMMKLENGIILTWEEFEQVHTHDYEKTVFEPTCQGGYTLYKCDCGDEYRSDFTPSVGHSYKDFVCTVCGAIDPSVTAFENRTWYTETVSADGSTAMRYWLNTTEKDSFGSETVGYPLSQRGGRRFDLLSEEEKAFAQEYSLIFELNGVRYAYSDENDGMELIDFSVEENKIVLSAWLWGEGETPVLIPCLVLQKTEADAFTVTEILNSDKSTYLHKSFAVGTTFVLDVQ